MNITRHERGWRLQAEQWLPAPPEEVWPFFSDARNLETITPDSLRFEVLTPTPIEMSEGTLIDYRLKVRGLPIRWRSRIAVWDPPRRFVDDQLKGPYRRWHHEHTFEARDGGTLCRDVVDYELYGGPLAPLIHAVFVRPDVRKIFAYRQHVLEERFGRADARAAQAAPNGERG